MVHIPYGRTVIEYDEGNANVLCSRIDELKAEADGLSIVKAAMENPIDSPRLCELAKGKKNCVIIISDHTRPVPSRDILPNMIAELKAGNPDIDITLLVATGFHRGTTKDELINNWARSSTTAARSSSTTAATQTATSRSASFPPAPPASLTDWLLRPTCWYPKALSSLTSSPASPAAERAFCPVSAIRSPFWATTAAASSTANRPAPARWTATPCMRTCWPPQSWQSLHSS